MTALREEESSRSEPSRAVILNQTKGITFIMTILGFIPE